MSIHQQLKATESTNPYGLDSPRAMQLIAAARAMGPALRMRRARCRADQRVPDETVAEFQAAARPAPGYWVLSRSTTGSWRCLMIARHRMCGLMTPRY
jgi:hypothetical protein